MTDSEIVALYWARDEHAILQTRMKYTRYLTKIAYGILPDMSDVEECENDTYLRAWNSMPENRPEVLSTYLGKIIRRLAIDIYRREHSQKRGGSEFALCLDELEEVLQTKGSVEEQLEQKELSAAISGFLKSRPVQKRMIFISRYFFMDTPKEIAKNTRMNEATVRSILMRERTALRLWLQKEGW